MTGLLCFLSQHNEFVLLNRELMNCPFEHKQSRTEKCAAKMVILRSLSLSYQKKDWQGPACQSFFCFDTDCAIYFVEAADYKSIVGVITNEGLAGPHPANPSFGMTPTKIFKDMFFAAHVSVHELPF